MSIPTFIFLLAIIAVLPAAIRVTGRPSIHVRNPTAFALVVMWLFSRVIWHLTGEWLPLSAMFIQDMVVIGAMFVKDDWRACPYRGTVHQIACLWIERTPWDRAILALFPVVWIFYFPVIDSRSQFWALWSLGLLQLMLAGFEGFRNSFAGHGQTLRAADDRPPGLEFTAWRRGHA